MGSQHRRRHWNIRIGARLKNDAPRANETDRERFEPNVFTWTGPGVENLFIPHEPARFQRRTRSRWN